MNRIEFIFYITFFPKQNQDSTDNEINNMICIGVIFGVFVNIEKYNTLMINFFTRKM